MWRSGGEGRRTHSLTSSHPVLNSQDKRGTVLPFISSSHFTHQASLDTPTHNALAHRVTLEGDDPAGRTGMRQIRGRGRTASGPQEGATRPGRLPSNGVARGEGGVGGGGGGGGSSSSPRWARNLYENLSAESDILSKFPATERLLSTRIF